MRGIIRNETYGGDYDCYVYSKRQAEALADKLEVIAKSVAVMAVKEAGIVAEAIEKPKGEEKPKKAKPLVLGVKGNKMINPRSAQRRLQRQNARKS